MSLGSFAFWAGVVLVLLTIFTPYPGMAWVSVKKWWNGTEIANPTLRPEEVNTFLQAESSKIDTVWHAIEVIEPKDSLAYSGNVIPQDARLFEVRFKSDDPGDHSYTLSTVHSRKSDRGKEVFLRCLRWSNRHNRYLPIPGKAVRWVLGEESFPKERFMPGTQAILLYGKKPCNVGFKFRK